MRDFSLLLFNQKASNFLSNISGALYLLQDYIRSPDLLCIGIWTVIWDVTAIEPVVELERPFISLNIILYRDLVRRLCK